MTDITKELAEALRAYSHWGATREVEMATHNALARYDAAPTDPAADQHPESWVEDILFSAYFCGGSAYHSEQLHAMLSAYPGLADAVIQRETRRVNEWNDRVHAAHAAATAPRSALASALAALDAAPQDGDVYWSALFAVVQEARRVAAAPVPDVERLADVITERVHALCEAIDSASMEKFDSDAWEKLIESPSIECLRAALTTRKEPQQ